MANAYESRSLQRVAKQMFANRPLPTAFSEIAQGENRMVSG